MKERSITGKVGQALRDCAGIGSCAFEVKVAKGKDMMYAQQLADHQRRALELAWKEKLYYKIEDGGYGQKPFDGFVLKYAQAFLVIWYQTGIKKHEVWALPVDRVPREGGIRLDYAQKNGLRLDV